MEAFDGLESGGYNAADWIEKVRRARLREAVERSISGDQHEYRNHCRGTSYRVVATGCGSRAAKLFRRLLEIVRSMIAPQLMHFQA